MAPRTCPKCTREIARTTEQCPHCGTILAPEAQAETIVYAAPPPASEPTVTASPPLQPAPTLTPSQQNTTNAPSVSPDITRTIELANSIRPLTLRCLAVCGIILVVVAVYISRPVPDPPTLPVGVAALISADGSLVAPSSTPSESGSTNTPATPQTNDGSYLSFLQTIDQRRVALVGGFNQELSTASSSTGTPAQPSQDYSQSAQGILRDFLAQKPPPDCSDVENSYFRLLQDESSVIDKSISSWHSGDAKGAAASRDSSASQVATDASSADASLASLCAQQHLDKPFTVQPGIVAGTSTPAATAPVTTPATAPPASTPAQPTTPTPGSTAPATPTPTAPTPAGTAPAPATTTTTNP